MNELEKVDLTLRLQHGMPIFVEGFGDITPLKMRDIIKFGYSKYMECLNIVSLDKSKLLPDVNPQELYDVTPLEILLLLGEDDLEDKLEESFSLFFQAEAIVDKEEVAIYIKYSEDDIKKIDKSNYEQVIEIIKWQNYINNFEDSESNDEDDEKTRKFKERLKKLQKETDKAKKRKGDSEDDEESLDISDILSAISSKSSNTNEIEVLDFTIFQVYRKFKRLEVIAQYDLNIKSIMAGAKDIKLKHWSSKID